MKIKIDLKIFLAILFYCFTKNIKIFALSFIFICVHELGHLLTGITLGLKIKEINIHILGFSIEFENYGKSRNINKIIIDLAGPIVNFIIAIISIFIKDSTIFYINILLIIANMLPIYPLDGGRIIKSMLIIKKSYKDTVIILENISNYTLIAITILTSFLILYFKNIAFLLFILYLWYISIKENRKNRIIQKVFKTIDNNM